MSTLTMVETATNAELSPVANRKRPMDFVPNKSTIVKSSRPTPFTPAVSLSDTNRWSCICCRAVPSSSCRHTVGQIDVSVPKISNSAGSSVVLSYAGYSAEGISPTNLKKQNQDSMIMMEDASSNSLVLACLDGHGLYGDKLSQVFKRGLEQRLFSHPLFLADPRAAICAVLSSIEEEVRTDEYHMADFSGTTLCLLMVRGNKLLVANIGDSRAVLGRRRPKHHHHQQLSGSTSGSSSSSAADSLDTPMVMSPGEGPPPAPFDSPMSVVGGSSSGPVKWRLSPHKLSVDHKPDRPDEYKRILSRGGRVFSVRYEDGVIGPARVWLPAANIPGLAMSRSLGDLIVHAVGVISTPEFHEIELSETEDCVLVVATDGLWDFLSNDEVMRMVASKADPAQAVRAMLEESKRRWIAKEEMVDDTTICVVHLAGFTSLLEQAKDKRSSRQNSRSPDNAMVMKVV